MVFRVDTQGNYLVAGSHAGSFNLGGGALTSDGTSDIFGGVLNSDYSHKWSRSYVSSGFPSGGAIATDSERSVYHGGYFSTSINLIDTTFTTAGTFDAWLVKCDLNGVYQWSKQMGDSVSSDSVYSLAVDSNDDLLVCGQFIGTYNFGGGNLTTASPLGSDWYVVKFDSDGTHIWSKRFGSTTTDEALSLRIAPDNSIYVSGFFGGTVNFGGGALVSAGSSDQALVKLTSAGDHVWSKRFGTSASETNSLQVALDPDANLIVLGTVSTAIDMGGGPLTIAGSSDVFIGKYGQSSGTYLWGTQITGTGLDSIAGPAVVTSDNKIYVNGRLTGTATIGSNTITTSSTGGDAFVACLDGSDGSFLWSSRYGGTSASSSRGIALGADGNLVFTGVFQGTANFGPVSFTSSGGNDVFLVKLRP